MTSTILEISCVFSPKANTSWLALSIRLNTLFTFSPARRAALLLCSAATEVSPAASAASSAESGGPLDAAGHLPDDLLGAGDQVGLGAGAEGDLPDRGPDLGGRRVDVLRRALQLGRRVGHAGRGVLDVAHQLAQVLLHVADGGGQLVDLVAAEAWLGGHRRGEVSAGDVEGAAAERAEPGDAGEHRREQQREHQGHAQGDQRLHHPAGVADEVQRAHQHHRQQEMRDEDLALERERHRWTPVFQRRRETPHRRSPPGSPGAGKLVQHGTANRSVASRRGHQCHAGRDSGVGRPGFHIPRRSRAAEYTPPHTQGRGFTRRGFGFPGPTPRASGRHRPPRCAVAIRGPRRRG